MSYLTKQLLTLSELYSSHHEIGLDTLSKRMLGNCERLPRMKLGKTNPTTPIWERGVQYLSNNWPDDLDWPNDIARPKAEVQDES